MAFKQLEPNKTVYTVGDFLEWGRAQSLDLTPAFQRRVVWKKSARSYLIDTILRGLPIPIIFLREATELKSLRTLRQVVDGQQRIHTILSYIEPEILKKMGRYSAERDEFYILRSHNKELGGAFFRNLSDEYKHRILSYQFSVQVLPSDTSDRDVLEIFRRMNSTGTALNAQELRNAKFFGYFASSVSNSALQQLDHWRSWKIFNEDQITRMNEVEMTADLYVYIINGISGRTKNTIDSVYSKFEENFPIQAHVENRFQHVFESMENVLGERIPKMSIARRTIFYGLFAVFYEFLYGAASEVNNSRPKKLPTGFQAAVLKLDATISSGRMPKKIADGLSKRTTHIGTRKTFVTYMIDQIKNETPN